MSLETEQLFKTQDSCPDLLVIAAKPHNASKRQKIFAVEDEIDARHDGLVAALEMRRQRTNRSQPLVTICWAVV